MCGRLIMTWPLLCNYYTSYEGNECKRLCCWRFHDLTAFTKKVGNKQIFTLRCCSASCLQLNSSRCMNITEMQASRFVEMSWSLSQTKNVMVLTIMSNKRNIRQFQIIYSFVIISVLVSTLIWKKSKHRTSNNYKTPS
jgi:hypothetical protein